MAPPPPCVPSALLPPLAGLLRKAAAAAYLDGAQKFQQSSPHFFPWPKVPPAASSATMASSPRQRAPPLLCCRTSLPLPRSLVAQRAPSPTYAASCTPQQHAPSPRALSARRITAASHTIWLRFAPPARRRVRLHATCAATTTED